MTNLSLDWLDRDTREIRQEIHRLLGYNCRGCSSPKVDIHHVKHDGGFWRKKFGGYSKEYYLDILWGVVNRLGEVALLCRECHTIHHEMYGFGQRVVPEPEQMEIWKPNENKNDHKAPEVE